MKLSDDIWEVICQKTRDYDGFELSDLHRAKIEEVMDITEFDGGVFVSYGNEFDLFVLPEKRGKWRIRSEVSAYLEKMLQKYGSIYIGIDERNHKSLRLARHFGFVETGRNGTKIRFRLEV